MKLLSKCDTQHNTTNNPLILPIMAAVAPPPRKIVVTGSGSGIFGASLVKILRERNAVPIGVDINPGDGVDVVADLSTAEGRDTMVSKVNEISGGVIDGVVANAGVLTYNSTEVKVNFFGAVATLEGLRPLLLKSPAPRAAVVSSVTCIMPQYQLELVNTILTGDEDAAVKMASEMAKDPRQAALIYASTKRALATWVRKTSVTEDWAGQGIVLNAVGPT